MKKIVLLLIAGSLLGSNYFTIDLGSFQLSLYRICVIALPILIIYSANKDIELHRLKSSRGYFSYKFMAFWIIYSLMSLIWVRDYNNWLKAFMFVMSGTLSIYFIGMYMNEEKDFMKVFKVIQLFIFGHSLLGYYQIFTGNYMLIQGKNQIYYSNTIGNTGFRIPMGMFSNPNDYALFCLMGFYISIICYYISIKNITKLFSLAMSISCAFLIICTQSRANFIGFLLSLLIYWMLSIKNSKIVKKILIIFLSMICILLIGYFIPDLYSTIIPQLSTVDLKGQILESDVIRINLIKNGMIFFNNTLFAGVGLGNIEYYMANYQVYYVGLVTDIHNWWFEILVSSGIVVFVGYTIMYVKNLKLLFKINNYSNNKGNVIIARTIFSFLIGFIIACTSSSSNINKEWLWVLWGIIYAFVNYGSLSLKRKEYCQL